MKILAVDTSTNFLTIGIFDQGRIYEYNLELGRKLSVFLHPTIQRVLGAAKLRLKELDYLACGLGPGSFTGMRVGLAAIKGICLAMEKPIIGIPSLDSLAQGVEVEGYPIVPIIDAKRNLFYSAVYKKSKGKLLKIKPYALLNSDELLKFIPKNSLILGDGINILRDNILHNIKGVKLLDKDLWYPKAHNILSLARQRGSLRKFDNLFTLDPVYLYPKECQVRKIVNK